MSKETGMESSKILETMVVLWKKSSSSYRDGLIEVGRMIHEYILTRLQEGRGLTEGNRQTKGITREKCLLSVSEELGIDRHKVNELLSTAMAVSLLSDNGKLGDIPYSTVREYSHLVKRINVGRGRPRGKDNIAKIEEWDINPLYVSWAKDSFREAVKERWTCREAQAFISVETKGISPKAHRKEEGVFNLIQKVRESDVVEVADLIMKIVGASENPQLLRRILECKLAQQEVKPLLRIHPTDLGSTNAYEQETIL